MIKAISKITGRDVLLDSVEQMASEDIVAMLKELVLNVTQHARRQGMQCRWWLSVEPDTESGRISFCLADGGIGIMKSKNVHDWKQVRRRELRSALLESRIRATLQRDHNILEKAIKGEILFTSTNEENRGKGLSTLRETASSSLVECLYLVTNKVLAEIVQDRYVGLNRALDGTLFLFETRPYFWNNDSTDETI